MGQLAKIDGVWYCAGIVAASAALPRGQPEAGRTGSCVIWGWGWALFWRDRRRLLWWAGLGFRHHPLRCRSAITAFGRVALGALRLGVLSGVGSGPVGGPPRLALNPFPKERPPRRVSDVTDQLAGLRVTSPSLGMRRTVATVGVAMLEEIGSGRRFEGLQVRPVLGTMALVESSTLRGCSVVAELTFGGFFTSRLSSTQQAQGLSKMEIP